jgi:hypothetical protein
MMAIEGAGSEALFSLDLSPNNARRGRLSPFLVLLGGLTNVTESIYVEEGSINGSDHSCDKVNWCSGEDDIDANEATVDWRSSGAPI